MTLQTVPTTNAPSYFQKATLDGVTFRLTFNWNDRTSCWYLSVADLDGVDVIVGVKLVVRDDLRFPLLRKLRDSRRPPGDLFVVTATADRSPPGLNDLLPSGRCSLLYATSDLLALVAAGQIQTAIDAVTTGTQDSAASTYGSQ